MQHILLDTNIIIYFLKGDPSIVYYLDGLGETIVHISIISWIETLVGSHHHQRKIDEIAFGLEHFARIPVNDTIGRTAAMIMQERLRYGKKREFQDSLIAATAIAHNMPLLTNNPRDFRGIKGLKILSPKR